MSAAIGGALLSISESAIAQCVPVVYAFRHAEDLDPVTDKLPQYTDDTPPSNTGNPHSLTRIGALHATLYVEMSKSLEITQNYCPVSTVYSIHPKKPRDGTYGTTNPYYTARPLANAVMKDNPIISVGGHRLGSKLEDGEAGPLKSAITNILMAAESVAIFWDSEGLNALGLTLNMASTVPVKTGTSGPPRNAAYIFEFKNGEIQPWNDSTPHYIQCFNWNPSAKDFSSYKYYCGNTQPNLGGTQIRPPPDR
jgi:hypothetical protein